MQQAATSVTQRQHLRFPLRDPTIPTFQPAHSATTSDPSRGYLTSEMRYQRVRSRAHPCTTAPRYIARQTGTCMHSLPRCMNACTPLPCYCAGQHNSYPSRFSVSLEAGYFPMHMTSRRLGEVWKTSGYSDSTSAAMVRNKYQPRRAACASPDIP